MSTDQQTIDANGAASAEDVMLVVDGVNDIVEGWANFAVSELQHNADDPCYRHIVLLDRRDASGAHRNIAENLSQGAAEDLQGAIALSLQGYRNDSVPGVWMHKSFLDWLIERNVLGADPTAIGLLLGGPIGAAAGKDYVRDRLPLSSQFDGGGPKRNPPAGKGVRIRHGVYMYARGANNDPLTQLDQGRLQGATIRAEYWQWKHYIERTVSGFARPLARWELRQLVGGGTGQVLGDFTLRAGAPAWVWRVGDPIDPNSIVGHLQEQEHLLNALIVGADLECKAFRGDAADRLDWGQDQAERDRDEAERENERGAEALGVWQRVAMLGIGAVVLIRASRR